jgi:acetolactate synthase-1/2/3 large subunit
LNALIQALKDQKLVNIDAWWKQIKGWRSVDSMAYQTKSGVIKPQSVIETLYEVTQGEAIVAVIQINNFNGGVILQHG